MNLIAFLIKLQSWWYSSRCSLSCVESDAAWSGILNGLVWVGAELPQGLRIVKGQLGLGAPTYEILQVPEARRVMPCLSRLEPTLPEPCIGCLPNSLHLIGIDPVMCEVLCEQVW